jgi:hypothetical protein
MFIRTLARDCFLKISLIEVLTHALDDILKSESEQEFLKILSEFKVSFFRGDIVFMFDRDCVVSQSTRTFCHKRFSFFSRKIQPEVIAFEG